MFLLEVERDLGRGELFDVNIEAKGPGFDRDGISVTGWIGGGEREREPEEEWVFEMREVGLGPLGTLALDKELSRTRVGRHSRDDDGIVIDAGLGLSGVL